MDKRIVLITGDGPQHRFMANRLVRECRIAGIVVDLGRSRTAVESIRLALRRYTITQLAGRLVLAMVRWIGGEQSRRAERLLGVFGTDSLAFNNPELVRYVHGINTEEGVSAVSRLSPEVLVVFGTSIVSVRVTSLARYYALNVHTGISPYYRGADCSFWPVHNLELHRLGATVHECTPVIDGGGIFATGRARLHQHDCLTSVFGRCVQVAADLLVSVLGQVQDGSLQAHVQDLTLGREFKARDRGLRAECRARYLVATGAVRQYVAAQQTVTLHAPRTTATN